MKEKNSLCNKFTVFSRALFITTFAVLTFLGVSGNKKPARYIPGENGIPVISTVLEAGSTYGGGSTDIYGFPATSAQALCLMSTDTGDTLYLQNADLPLPMASTTKIMTALVVLENCDPEKIFTVPREACGIEGSSIYLTEDEKITVRDLLYGLLLESGNDAACALAIACCGNVEDFVSLMNSTGQRMGLVNTSFANPHGLSADNHHTTARELAVIARAAMQNPLFREIVKTKSYTVKGEHGEPTKYFSNHNKLLRSYDGAIGIKTGYTISAGRCLVTSAERNGTEFIAVTLNDRQDFADHKAMYDFAFENFEAVTYADKEKICGMFGGCEFYNKDGIKILRYKNDGKTSYSAEITLEKRSDFNNN